MKILKKDDPRQIAPQCHDLQPVETVHSNPWFSVKNRGGYYTVEYHQSQVVVLPVVDHRAVLMVRVKRPVLNDVPLELPAGGRLIHETAAQTALREMREETGVLIDDVNRLQPLPSFAISSARYPVLPYVFQLDLTDGEFAERGLSDDEIVAVECWSFFELKQMIVDGKIYVGLPVAILSAFLFRRDLRAQS